MSKRFKNFYVGYMIVLLNLVAPIMDGFWYGMNSNNGVRMYGSFGSWFVINVWYPFLEFCIQVVR